jgi:hypothetical protein
MLGLMYLGAAALYLALMFVVVRWAWRKGRADGGSFVKASALALVGFLTVYLPAFWNHIPIVLAHRSMCAKDAGFKANVTPEQWIAENKEALSKLTRQDIQGTSPSRELPDGFSRYEFLGGLLARESSEKYSTLYGVSVVRQEERVLDTRTNKPVLSRVDYHIGQRDDARLWLAGRKCLADDDPKSPSKLRQKFVQRIQEEIK